MLIQSEQLKKTSISSLHTGRRIGELCDPIINPYKLEVLGFYVGEKEDQHVLLVQDIRSFAPNKVIIDSSDEIIGAKELLRIQETLEIDYHLVGKSVYTESQDRLGKVEEYVLDTDTFLIQKVYVKQPLIKNLTKRNLIIDRDQIIEVTDKHVIVSDAFIRSPAMVTTGA